MEPAAEGGVLCGAKLTFRWTVKRVGRTGESPVGVTIRDFDAPIKRVKILFLYSPDISVFFAFRPLGV